jgi:GWxTD domain-containing protein
MKWTWVGVLLWISFTANGLNPWISTCVFKSEGSGYVEVYFHIPAESATFVVLPDSSFVASVEVVILFQQMATIARYDKFTMHSPSMALPADFIDIKRYALPDGSYDMRVEIKDLNRPGDIRSIQSPVTLDLNQETLLQSDIQLLAAVYRDSSDSPFSKNGLFLEPLAFQTYNKDAFQLAFYHEIYHTDTALSDDYLVSYRVDANEPDNTRTLLIGHKRRKPLPVDPLVILMDISTLPTGNYRLVVEVRNRMQELVSQKQTFFRRENPFYRPTPADLANMPLDREFVAALSADQLRLGLRAISPRLAGKEQEKLNLLIKSDSTDLQRRYLFTYWIGQAPNTPELAWRQYMKVVQSVDNTFVSGFRRGFETDRGHIYLKYGPPDDIETREQEPSAPPYEIWSYYHFPTTRQNNVKFIFYNPSLAPGDYVLLHSDAIGERQNPQWIRDLYKNAPAEWEGNAIDGNDIMDNFNRNAKRVLRDN